MLNKEAIFKKNYFGDNLSSLSPRNTLASAFVYFRYIGILYRMSDNCMLHV